MKQLLMPCDEYLEGLWCYDQGLHELISEQFWSGGVDTYELFEYMKTVAVIQHITLTDVDTWNYDKALYEAYKSDQDRGLS